MAKTKPSATKTLNFCLATFAVALPTMVIVSKLAVTGSGEGGVRRHKPTGNSYCVPGIE